MKYPTPIFLVDARRSPIGRFGGGLASLAATDLALPVAEAMVPAELKAALDQVILGQVLPALRRQVPGTVFTIGVHDAPPWVEAAAGPGLEVLWRGAAVATLVAGESSLSPRVEVLGSDLLDAPLKEKVRRRLAAWVEAHLRGALGPLFALRDSAPAGTARGLAFALAEGLGAVSRRSVAKQVTALGAPDRSELSRLGVSIGPAPAGGNSYVGAKTCRGCHPKTFAAWAASCGEKPQVGRKTLT
jgi:hypothetical protein